MLILSYSIEGCTTTAIWIMNNARHVIIPDYKESDKSVQGICK